MAARTSSHSRRTALSVGIAFACILIGLQLFRVNSARWVLFNFAQGLRLSPNHTIRYAVPSAHIRQYDFPPADARYRLTFFHATVLHRNETYRHTASWDASLSGWYVSILAFLEDRWVQAEGFQLMTPDTKLYDRMTCFSSTPGRLDSNIFSADVRDLRTALYINCPLPSDFDPSNASGPLTTNVTWAFQNAVGNFTFELHPKAVEPSTEVAICVNPIFAHLPAVRLLEWREHHRRLGIRTVYWYARDASVRKFVDRYKSSTGVSDTFVHSPPVSLATYGKMGPTLLQVGLYADQILYYQDCKQRAYAQAPARWLAMIDLDEALIPAQLLSPTNNSTLGTFLEEQPDDVGSVCFDRVLQGATARTDVSSLVPDSVKKSWPLELAYFDASVAPSKDRPGKCIHRLTGSESIYVHSGQSWYPGFKARLYAAQDAPLVVWHMSSGIGRHADWGSPGSTTVTFRKWLAELWIARENLAKKMKWSCGDVPCRFDGEENLGE